MEREEFRGMAMDDYGTGSASSGIVLYAPMDEIKLDMSFIRGITEDSKKQAMVRSIVDFANSCGMSTCLEGVETEELQNYLRTFNATWFQGYYYSKPVEIDRFRELVETNICWWGLLSNFPTHTSLRRIRHIQAYAEFNGIG